ncbi:putative PHD finger protein ALFIN-LIKE 4-like [Capsicum annuum]|nr:putative PHD finger protein ALFIN-LIKE 4-like [Capsicum annuum]
MAGIPSKKGKSQGAKPSKLELNSAGLDSDSEYVSLKDLAPLAMDKIEALSIEGLRIQSAIEEKKVNFGGVVGLEGTGGLHILDLNDGGDVDGLMGLSLTLEEWMRLGAGEIDEISERTSKLLATHHATRIDLFCGRNYESVGTPMLALVQVERVFVTPQLKICSKVRKNNKDADGNAEPQKRNLVWRRDKVKRNYGARQLNSNLDHIGCWRMEWERRIKYPLLKSKDGGSKSSIVVASQATTTVHPGETLWSISSRAHGTGATWKELTTLNPHIQNPNVIFPN